VEHDGEQLTLSAPKLRMLLVTLLLHANRVVPFTALEAALWPTRPPESTRGAIHTYVMRLRRALGPGLPIHTRATGYSVETDPATIDVEVFRAHLDEARAARTAGAAAGEHAALTAALALWRGPVLPDLPPESVLDDVVRVLDEQRLDAVVRRAVLDTEAGRHHDAVTALRPVTTAHPLRGEVWEALIRALHRAGRVAEALDAYREVRQKFRDELGLDPDERIQQLHAAVLATDRLADTPQDETVTPVPRQLPIVPGGFSGRSAEIQALTDRLSRGGPAVVVVSGPPGVGKTALVVAVAHRVRVGYPDGQLHVDLRGYSHDEPLLPQVVLTRFLRDLGVPVKQVPAELDDQANLFRSLVADQRVLVVLDNAATAEQIRPLLPGSGGCAVVVSSRDELRGLAVDGAQHIRLGPLGDQDARVVLEHVLGPDTVDEAGADVDRLVRACGGLPLALRIAGANLAANPHLRIADYADDLRLAGRLDQLRVPGDEQLAVRAAFDLSHERLPTAIARRFRLLGVLPGPDFGVHAVAALTDTDETTARRTLDHLAAANLIVATGPGRYQLHDLIREYAAAKAAEHVDVAAAATRLWDHYLTHAYAAADLLHSGRSRLPAPGAATFADEVTARTWLDTEHPNLVAAIRAATDRGLPAYAGRLLDAMRGYLCLRGDPAETLMLCEVAAAAAAAVGDRAAEASAIDLVGLTHFGASRFELATEHHVRALGISRACGDLAGQADSLHNIGRSSAQTMPTSTARRYYREAYEIAERTGDLSAQARNMNYIGASYHSSGEFTEARDWLQRAMELSRRTGNMSVINSALGNLGNVEWSLGNLRGAVSLLAEAGAVAERLGNLSVQAITHIAEAEVLCDLGDFDRALRKADRGAELSVRIGERRHQISGIEVATTAAFRNGDTDGVEPSYVDALRAAREISFVYGEVSTAIALAVVHRYHGRSGPAVALIESALDRMRETGVHDLEAHALVQIGHAHRVGGDTECAKAAVRRALSVARSRGSQLVEARALHLVSLLDEADEPREQADAILQSIGAASPDIVP
jgi:DNA-binding SARP family transcriptional activator/tetratricopeptide (TPR) repeat protein